MQNVTDMKKGIAVAGSILVDKINEISAYPTAGELTKIFRASLAVGGCVPNVTIDLKRMDHTLDVQAIGNVGQDEEGAFVKSTLAKNGVDCNGIKETSEKTSFTEVMSVVGGQRTFFTYAGASAAFGVEDIHFDTLNAKMLHLVYFVVKYKYEDYSYNRHTQSNKRCGKSYCNHRRSNRCYPPW